MERARQMYSILQQSNLNLKECKFLTGQLTTFKRQHNISMQTLHGKEDSIVLTVEVWDQFLALNATISSFEDKDVFNMDETGLFYKLQPNKTFQDKVVKGKVHGQNHHCIDFKHGWAYEAPTCSNQQIREASMLHIVQDQVARQPQNLLVC